MTDMTPCDVSAHGPLARITPRPSRPSPVARDTSARVDPLREWLRLRTIVDTLLQRVSTSQDGTTSRTRHPIATNEEHLDG
jgi:hypothetical protein